MDNKILLIAVLALFTASSFMNSNSVSVGYTSDFASFKAEHVKEYATAEEEAYRFAVFVSNGEKIKQLNAQKGAVFGYTAFADLTEEEFASKYLTYQAQNKKWEAPVHEETSFVGDVNWVEQGKVQEVKNQGSCGSCWAFSTVASTESLAAISTGTLPDFSEQQLVSCSSKFGNKGCLGGLMDDGFQYYEANAICTESSYPYKGWLGQLAGCKASKCTDGSFKISGFTDVKAKSTSALRSACDKQPISIAVGAGGSGWQLYKSGIMKPSQCNDKLDHGVLLAGYTSEYWLVKNSWAATWGEKGYIRLDGTADTCGLADQASFPTV